ncbi:MAG: catechol 2,3-dioxygenase-like lactoylglutathione lyase family enzyme [Candidatus Azotimanducaceae bacterium]|jgi:catechol 2,3-dioxygenase-like lactoylglutathione lyase family enzyme
MHRVACGVSIGTSAGKENMHQTSPLEFGLPVIDLDRMITFYTQVFSCTELRRAEIPPELSRKIRVSEDGYTNVWLQFPGGEVVKLVRPPVAPIRAEPQEYSSNSTGIAYFTLYCDDIIDAIAAAEASGGVLISDRDLYEQSAEGASPIKLAFLTDPEGNVFEFVER